MSFLTKINGDIKQAMLAKEKDKLATLRAIKSALLLALTKEGASDEISEPESIKILQKLHKQRNEAAKIYNQQNRADLAAVEEKEADFISAYLPTMMDEEGVKEIVEQIILKVGANGPSDMGKVMGIVMGQLKGKAEGGLISRVVKDLLNK
ncbi:MAG: GatB/YqeY domain-containing protein [Parvicellaceae bacterium]